ncbi:hypothetical protein RJ640_023518 [Escallonia rubra]|uniref:PRP8 domain-containing protein n=1 Tax=Escallonia rubra TaxID=112253 RepID=A0AA88RQ43_9ASTE|nr:hypothetical protein RJ640_023518 [Escallonia rubra]
MEGLQLHSPDYNNQIIWYVDDTSIFRATVDKTANGRLTAKRVNGVVFTFNPRTGQLFLQSVPLHEHAAQAVLNPSGMLKPLLEARLQDAPNVAVSAGGEQMVPLSALLKVPTINDLVVEAKETRTFVLNAYDDWLDSVSCSAALSRLCLILRNLHADNERANGLLRPAAEPHHLWPSITLDQWVTAEFALEHLEHNQRSMAT